MILYDFKCESCGHEMETLININDNNPKCPKCKKHMIRVISAVSFILKGRNWAKDNYGLKNNKKD